MTAAERTKHFLDHIGLTEREFNRRTGFSNGLLSGAVKKGRALGSDKLESILRAFPELDPEWLLTGEGPMLREEEKST